MKILYIISHIFNGCINYIKYKIYRPYRIKQHILFDKRLKICESCEFCDKTFRQCTECGCFIDVKTKVIYKLDEYDFAISYIDPTNKEIYYACPKKFW